MTREEFKDLAMEIIAQQTTHFLNRDWKLFDSENIDDYKIAEYDEIESDVAAYPLEEFLDELWKVAFNDDYNAEMKKWWDKRIADCER